MPWDLKEVDLAARRRRRQIYQLGQYKKKKLSVSDPDTKDLLLLLGHAFKAELSLKKKRDMRFGTLHAVFLAPLLPLFTP